MSGENYTNTASGNASTSAPIGPSDLTVTVASYTGYPSAPYWAELEKGTASAEIVRVTNVAGSVLTITRGQGGTAATSHGAGVTFEHIVPASHFNETEAHMAAVTAHGVTGVVVGTQGAQTVQDKLFRGAVKSQHSDTLPVGITASFESVADTAGARDGFVHRNTAGDGARAGFLLQQSGADRFKVRNDGTVDVAPGASANPGFRNHGTTVLDSTASVAGALTVSSGGASVTGGLVVPSGGATVTGNSTVTGTLGVSSTATVGSLTTAGTVHANGSIDTDTNLVVDGTSTLTGTVTAGAAVNATGALTGASATVTGAVSAQGAKVTTFQSGSDYGTQSELIVTNGARTRNTRQALFTQVRRLNINWVIASTSAHEYTRFNYTPRSNSHLNLVFACHFEPNTSGGTSVDYNPTESSFQVRILDNTGVTVHDSSDLYIMSTGSVDSAPYKIPRIITVPFLSAFEMTAGVTYRIQLWGQRTPTSGLQQKLVHVIGTLEEAAVLGLIT